MDSVLRDTAGAVHETTAVERARERERKRAVPIISGTFVIRFLASSFIIFLTAVVLFNYIRMVSLQKSISETQHVILKVIRSSDSMNSKILEGSNYTVIRDTVISAGYRERETEEGITVNLSEDNFPSAESADDVKLK